MHSWSKDYRCMNYEGENYEDMARYIVDGITVQCDKSESSVRSFVNNNSTQRSGSTYLSIN